MELGGALDKKRLIMGSDDGVQNEYIILFPLSRMKSTLAPMRVERSTTTLEKPHVS
jgi:hypothetical protein